MDFCFLRHPSLISKNRKENIICTMYDVNGKKLNINMFDKWEKMGGRAKHFTVLLHRTNRFKINPVKGTMLKCVCQRFAKKLQEGNDNEKAQSERNSHSKKNEVGKT